MSSAVVRQALQLFQFEEDFVSETENSVRKKKKKTKDPMKVIGTSKVGVQKKLRKLKKEEEKRKALKGKTIKCAVDEYRKRTKEDHTNKNVSFLHRMSKACQTDSKVTQTILEQHVGRLAKNRPDSEKKEEARVFTDHDFEQFAKEYFT